MPPDPTDPMAVRRESLLALSRTHHLWGLDHLDTATQVSDAPLRSAMQDAGAVLLALAYALEWAADGDALPLAELAAEATGQLAEQRFAPVAGLAVRAPGAGIDPTHN